MKKPDMIVLVAVWNFLNVVVPAIGITAIILFAIPEITHLDGIARTGGMFGVVIGMVFLGCFSLLSMIGGIGVLAGREWGRMVCLVQAGLCLLVVPVGTIIGVLIINYLGKAEVKEYFNPGTN